MNNINWIKKFFQTPSSETLALLELEDAKRQLLVALSAQEYAEAMVKYHSDRVNRLSKAPK
jgi:hypothetical protein